MPKIVVEGPDGRKFAFPDTMPRAEINAFMRTKYGTKARDESVQDYLARYGREQAATEARAKDIDLEATAAGRAEGERAAGRMGVSNPFEMAFAAPAIGLAQQEGGRRVFEREGTVLADEAAGLSAINAAGFFVPGMVNREFGARVEEGRRQQPLAAFAGDVAGGFGPGEIIGAGVAKAAQAVGPSMAALGRMFSGQKISPEMQSTLQQTAMGSIGGSAYGNFNDVNQDGVIDQQDVYAGAVAGGVGLPATVKGAQVASDFMPAPRAAPRVAPDAMPAGGYFGRQSMRPPGSGPSPREIELRQEWSTATPIVTQARTTAQSAQQAAEAALQSKAPADIARAKDQKKALVGQLQEAQASRAGMNTPEDARLAETLASLTENTSDPVLLSTQISAAKTSLDRLLTDIGSPVEGNLIPVRTNILTRTQAPRSAAEGPHDRASVTRYAEGGDEIKPQGFGASTPKTFQQAERFFSGLQKAIPTLKPEKATAEQWKGMLNNAPGVKKEELEWTGVSDWLDAQRGQVSKADLDAYVKANGVKIEEVVKTGGVLPNAEEYRRQLRPLIERRDEVTRQMNAEYRDPDGPDLNLISKLEDEEQLLQSQIDELENFSGIDGQSDDTKWASYTLPGGENYTELLLKLPKGPGYMSSQPEHWDEFDVLAHVRFKDRTGPNGERILAMEEIQSDWHQEGRKQGYGKLIPDAPFKNEGWTNLALNRMIRKAAEEGYDGISWIPGKIQNGAIVNAADNRADFYDKIVVNAANKIGKKYGAKAERLDGVATTKEGEPVSLHYMRVTPELKRKALEEGFPLFAAAPFAAVGGAGLTSERELGSKMKRDKKD